MAGPGRGRHWYNSGPRRPPSAGRNRRAAGGRRECHPAFRGRGRPGRRVAALPGGPARFLSAKRPGRRSPGGRSPGWKPTRGDPPIRVRAIVEGAIDQGGSEALGKCVQWMQARSETRAADGRVGRPAARSAGQGRGRRRPVHAGDGVAPPFADGWSARLLAAARLGEPEANDVIALAARPWTGRRSSRCAPRSGPRSGRRCRPGRRRSNPPRTRRSYAQACIAACEARGRLEDAVPVLSSHGRGQGHAEGRRGLGETDDRRPDRGPRDRPTRSETPLNALRTTADAPATVAEARRPCQRPGHRLAVGRRGRPAGRRRRHDRPVDRVVRDPAATSNDWFQLAQLYRVAGDRANCRKCLEELTTPGAEEPVLRWRLAVDDLLSDNRAGDGPAARGQDRGRRGRLSRPGSAARYLTLANQPVAGPRTRREVCPGGGPGTAEAAARQRQAAETARPAHPAVGQPGAERVQAAAGRGGRAVPGVLRAYPEAVVPLAGLLRVRRPRGCRHSTSWSGTRPGSRDPPSRRPGSPSCGAGTPAQGSFRQ